MLKGRTKKKKGDALQGSGYQKRESVIVPWRRERFPGAGLERVLRWVFIQALLKNRVHSELAGEVYPELSVRF